MSIAIGIDLGGTKIDVGVVDQYGNVLERLLIPTRVAEGPKVIVEDIAECIRKLSQNRKLLGAGIGMAGQIDKATGNVFFAPNLKWRDFPLQEELYKGIQMPVVVINDVRAATIGEWLHGAGQNCKDLLCIFVGTGIGSGVVSNGHLLVGHTNAAGEIGHMTIQIDGPLCTCGNHGCFESLAGGWGIARRVKEVVASKQEGCDVLLDLADGHLEGLSAKQVFAAYHQGLPLAKKLVEEISTALVAGIASAVNAYNPAKIILGGGIVQRFPEFIEIVQKNIGSRALKAATSSMQIVPAQLHNDAGVVGAADLILNKGMI